MSYHSIKAIGYQWVIEWVYVFVCFLTPPKRLNLMSWNFEEWFPWDEEGSRFKNIRMRQTVSRKIKKNMSVYKRHLAFSEASERRNHSEVLYLNLFKKTTTCVVAKPLVLYQSNTMSVCLFVITLLRNMFATSFIDTSVFATTHVVVSVRHPITY